MKKMNGRAAVGQFQGALWPVGRAVSMAMCLLLCSTLACPAPLTSPEPDQPNAPMPVTPVIEPTDDAADGLAKDAKEEAVWPKIELTNKMLYEFLLAEIAGQRGEAALSAEVYFDLAKNTRDPRIVRRATEAALYARQYTTALEAARMWVAVDPQDKKAQQMLATMLMVTGRGDELAENLSRELAGAGGRTGELLLAQQRALASYPDKAAVKKIVDKITTPYIAAPSDLPEAHWVRARAAQAVGDKTSALREIEQALALRPVWDDAVLLKASFLPTGGAQRDFLKTYLSAHRDAQTVRLAYARALVADARYDDARDEFKLLLKANPDNPGVLFAIGILSLQVNDMATAEKSLKRMVALGQGELDTARFYLGQIAEHAGRRDEALDWYRAVANGEQKLPAHVRAAQLLAQQDQLDEAREQLEIARSGTVDDSRLVIAEAQLFRQQNRHAEAYAVLQSALAEQADDPELLYETALAAEKVNDVAKMEQHLRRLIELKPGEAMAYNALGYSLAERNVRLPEAAALIDKALSIAPDDAFILDSKGWVLFRQGKLDEALTLLKKAYAIRPDPEIAAHTGEVLWQLGRRDEALKIWREAKKMHPDNEAVKAVIKRFLP